MSGGQRKSVTVTESRVRNKNLQHILGVYVQCVHLKVEHRKNGKKFYCSTVYGVNEVDGRRVL